jgi:hypothetical protein
MRTARLISGAILSGLLLGCNEVPQTGPSNTAANPNLVGLVFSAGPLSPAFDSSTLQYTIAVAYEVNRTTVTPTGSASSDASLFLNGVAVLSGSPSGVIDLDVGVNTFSIVVTSGSARKTYQVAVTRAKQVGVFLSGLKIGRKDFDLFEHLAVNPHPFNPDDTVYSLASPGDTASLGFYPTVADTQALHVTVNGKAVPSGGEFIADVSKPPNTIRIVVASVTGAAKTYTVTVTRNTTTPFENPTVLRIGAQGSPTLGSTVDLDTKAVLFSAAANANEETIDLVFLYYAGAFHLDNAVAAKAAGIANNINLTDSYDNSRIKDTRIVKVSAKPKDQESARIALQAGPESSSNIVKGGEIFLVLTTEGKVALVTVGAINGDNYAGDGQLSVSLGSP